MKRAIAVLLAATLLLFVVGCGESAATPSSSSTSPSSTSPMSSVEGEDLDISITGLEGTARTLRGDGTAEILTLGSELGVGDSIITDRDSTVDLQVSDLSTFITVSPSSEILFDTASSAEDGRELVIVVRKGSISNSVDVKLEAGDIYEVCTGDMTMAIRGTDVLVQSENGVTSISLLTGSALVYNYYDEQVYVVPAGVMGHFMPDDEPVFEIIQLGSYAGISEAAEALIKNAEADDKEYFQAEEFERELRDSYLVTDGTYSFSVTSPLVESSDDTETTTATVTSAVETTSETTTSATTTARTTARTTTKKTTTGSTPTVPTASSTPTVTEPTASTAPSSSTEPTEPTEP